MNGLVTYIFFILQYITISVNSYNCSSNAYQYTLKERYDSNSNIRKYNEFIYLT